MASLKINWEDVLTKIAIGAFILFFSGMTLYAMQRMSPQDKDDIIIMLQQQQQLQE